MIDHIQLCNIVWMIRCRYNLFSTEYYMYKFSGLSRIFQILFLQSVSIVSIFVDKTISPPIKALNEPPSVPPGSAPCSTPLVISSTNRTNAYWQNSHLSTLQLSFYLHSSKNFLFQQPPFLPLCGDIIKMIDTHYNNNCLHLLLTAKKYHRCKAHHNLKRL